jgi:hypothetical protein
MAESRDNIIPFPGLASPHALVLRVELVLAPRPIWRLLQIAGASTFWDLHVAIQDAMGWEDRHVHRFTTHHPVTGEKLRFGTPELSDFYGSSEVVPGWEVQVRDVLRPDYPPIVYIYDLGAEWQHEISLEAVVPAVEAGPCPRCLSGEGAGPPEDCGGMSGYRHLLAAGRDLNDAPRGHADGALSEGYDADAFEPQDVVFSDPRRRWSEVFGED